MRLTAFICFVVIVSATGLAGCQASTAKTALTDKIDAVIALESEQPSPGYAIGVVRNGALVFAKGYGVADIATGEPLTADTPFNLASLSKQFTGAAVALEVQKERLDLDDRLIKHWPGIPDFMQDITIGHLVYMTSGLPEYYSLPSPKGGWDSEDRFTVEDAIGAVFAAGVLDYAPGSRWTYSNINYQLLAELTARLNKKSFGEHMDEAIFSPLDMKQSWIDDKLQSRSRQSANTYVWDEENALWRTAPRLSPHYGGSGMFASVADLAKWDKALFSTQPLGPAFTEILLGTKQFDHDKTNDAFGLVHGNHKGSHTVWYEGGDYGVSTYMIRLMDEQTTVICLANFGNAGCRDKAIAILAIVTNP